MKKRALMLRGDAHLPYSRAAQLEMLAGVATKALEMGKAAEAERLLAPAVADFQTFAERASSADDWELVAKMHAILTPVLPRLAAATGKAWTRCLQTVAQKAWMPQPPPRGQA